MYLVAHTKDGRCSQPTLHSRSHDAAIVHESTGPTFGSRRIAAYGLAIVAVAFLLFLVFSPRRGPTNVAVVVPHHDIVKKQRLEFWQQLNGKITTDRVERVIIIGPDHFGGNQQIVSYDDTDWTTATTPLKNLLKNQLNLPDTFQKNTGLIKADHAVVNLTGEIKQNFPNASFAPFLIGRDVAFRDLHPVAEYIHALCREKSCVLIASVDFSHYVKRAVADARDKRTVELLANKSLTEKSLNQGETIEADSPQSLYVLQEFARGYGLDYWWLQNQTNSAFGNPDVTDTTSHVFAGYLKQ